ncbi:MAG: permease-like cell division protein FtsX [Actinomycetes bacterium]
MPIFAEYAVRETASNLWRNRLMTIAAILTVTVSLALVGAALLLKQGAANAEVEWQRGTQVVIWMNPSASGSERDAVATQLKDLRYVHGCVFRNHRYDFEEARKLLTPSTFAVLTPDIVPTSFRCTPDQPQDAQIVINHFTGQSGVKEVTAPLQQIRAMEQTIKVLQWVFVGVAGVLLLSATVLILNTIRLAIFARRREVSVMKLVGATNWFIRIPFMSEGLVQGLLGSILAALLVLGLHIWLNALGDPSNPNAVLTQMRLTGWQVFWTDGVLVGMGGLIGAGGSAIAIRRFLDV